LAFRCSSARERGTENSQRSTVDSQQQKLFAGVRVPDFLQCIIGFVIGFIGCGVIGVWIGMKLYWKTGHW
jgi:hypothetical protein